MKDKVKIAIIVIVVLIVSLIAINLIERGGKKELTGKLNIVVNSSNYKYINSVAEKFKTTNPKVKIDIKEVNNKDYYNYILNEVKKGKYPDIALLNNKEIRVLMDKEKIEPINLNSVINTYRMNFAQERLNEVNIDKNFYGVPFTSNPLVFYAREDMLKQYGYTSNDINTWQDVITIGKDIYTKSKGQVRLLSGIGDDYNKLVSLLILENMNQGLDEKTVLKNTTDMLNELKKDNILAMNINEEYAGKIGSIEQMKSIDGIKEKCNWTANNPPALVVGGNKFYESGGENLIALNKENEALSKEFISFVSNSTKISLEYTLSGSLFSSYQYTYKDTEIENKINNFSGKSPLVIMSNITEKAPVIKNYDMYLKVKESIIKEK